MSSRPMTAAHTNCTNSSQRIVKMRGGGWASSFYAVKCFALLLCISSNGIRGIQHGQRISILEPKRYSNVSLYDRPIIGITIAVDNASHIKDQCLPETTAVLTIIVNNLDEHKQFFDLQVLATTSDPKHFVRNMTKLSHHFMCPSCFIQPSYIFKIQKWRRIVLLPDDLALAQLIIIQ